MKKGFTLIELLIVVAIIAILAAIAVPNFLEAQTRAKVSRVKADMRSLAVGVETYRIDNNRVFPTTRLNQAQTRAWIWGYMTTPIAYLTSVPRDPFNNTEADDNNKVITIWGPDYIDPSPAIRHRDGTTIPASDGGASAARITRSTRFFSPYPGVVADANYTNGGGEMRRNNFFVLISYGPEQSFTILTPSFPAPMIPYDPTNGTISVGDVVYFQGGQFGS